MASESAVFVGTLIAAAGGLVAAYLRLRLEFERTVAILSTVLLAGATPLYAAVVLDRESVDVLFFSMLSLLAFFLVRTRDAKHLAALPIVALVVPVIAPMAEIPPTLFSTPRGFLAMTPVVYLGALGMLMSVRDRAMESAAAMIALAMWPPLDTSLTPALAFLAPGVAVVVDWARRRPLIAAAPVVVAAIVWNYWLMVQYTVGTIPKDAPVSFAALVRQQADVHTRPPYVYPFAFPGNAILAWRDGVPLGQYDALSVAPRGEIFDVPLDRNADRWLLEGWGPAGSDSAGAFRPVTGTRARMFFPLEPTARDSEVVILAAARGGAATVRVELNGRAIGAFDVPAGQRLDGRLRVSAAEGRRILRTGYNQLSIVTDGNVAIHRVRVSPAQ